MSYIIIPRGDGYVSYSNVDPETMDLSEDAEIYDNREDFQDRLSDFDHS